MKQRPRRNRRKSALRDLVSETGLGSEHLIWPVFVCDGSNVRQEVPSMPGVYRWSLDLLVRELSELVPLGLRALALFPVVDAGRKDSLAKESVNPDGILQRSLRQIKKQFPELVLISDVAMDPYSSDGHDGLVRDGHIINDETLPILAAMAVSQAEAGADLVAPSDMMDGRVAFIRDALDRAGFQNVGILSYTAKYASAFYGPFRDALDSAPKFGDKKTYQMDPRNRIEAIREAKLDITEGADIVMVKPGLAYLDILSDIKKAVSVPVAVYQVSGEYAMIMAAHEKKWIDGPRVMMECLMSMRRAGADMILSYWTDRFLRL